MRKLPQPSSDWLPADLITLSSDRLHEWKEYLTQEVNHYKTLEPDKAYIYQGYLNRVKAEQAKRKA